MKINTDPTHPNRKRLDNLYRRYSDLGDKIEEIRVDRQRLVEEIKQALYWPTDKCSHTNPCGPTTQHKPWVCASEAADKSFTFYCIKCDSDLTGEQFMVAIYNHRINLCNARRRRLVNLLEAKKGSKAVKTIQDLEWHIQGLDSKIAHHQEQLKDLPKALRDFHADPHSIWNN